MNGNARNTFDSAVGYLLALAAIAFMFDGERRAAVAAAREEGGVALREGYQHPSVG